jgi:hypothetical protein
MADHASPDLPAELSTRIGSEFCYVGKLKWAVVSCWLPLSGRLLLRAVRAGQLEARAAELAARAWEPCEEDGEDLCASAAAGGHLAVLQCARANGCPWGGWTCGMAAQGGHLVVLQWACANGGPWEVFALRSVGRGGYLAVLQWARANGCPGHEDTCRGAAGPVRVGTWPCCRRSGLVRLRMAAVGSKGPYIAAAAIGHATVLDWARANGCPESYNSED